MGMRHLVVKVVTLGLTISGGNSVVAQDGGTSFDDAELKARQMEIDLRSQIALDNLLATNSSAQILFNPAVGYAVFEVTKAGGFLVTGAVGSGVAINRGTGDRSYMRMGSAGVGFGLGAQRYDLIVMFEQEYHLQSFLNGGWDSSATAQAAAGQEGVNVTSSFIDGVAFFQVTDKGLIAIADVAGTRFWIAENLN